MVGGLLIRVCTLWHLRAGVLGPEAGAEGGWGFSEELASRVQDIEPHAWVMFSGHEWLKGTEVDLSVSFTPMATAWGAVRKLWGAALTFGKSGEDFASREITRETTQQRLRKKLGDEADEAFQKNPHAEKMAFSKLPAKKMKLRDNPFKHTTSSETLMAVKI